MAIKERERERKKERKRKESLSINAHEFSSLKIERDSHAPYKEREEEIRRK